MENEEGFYVDLADEEGNNFKLEIVGDVEYENELYRVFRHLVLDLRMLIGLYLLIEAAEQKQHHRNGHQRTQLHREEDAGFSLHPEE